VAKAVKDATEKLKEYTDALKSSNSAQKSFTSAQKASVKAGQSLTDANQGVADAQAALDKAVSGFGADSPEARKAAKDLELANRGLERAGYNVEQSIFAVADAEAALKKVRADPESTPQMIREAEIDLAEAKLSSADATDQQAEATDGLRTAQGLLNEKVSGALTDSETYKTLTEQLKDAKEKQATATDDVAEAIERETAALDAYAKAIEAAGKIAKLYPKIAAKNPMAGSAATIPATVTGNSTGFKRPEEGGGMVVNVNAGLISSPATLSQEIVDLLTDYSRLNGSINFGGGGFGLTK
jgi:DNA repair exonuclease SbcCD ATPase subunit